MTQQNTEPEQEITADNTGTRYAAYDKTYQRFVGGVHNTKAKASEAAKAEGVKASDTEIREV